MAWNVSGLLSNYRKNLLGDLMGEEIGQSRDAGGLPEHAPSQERPTSGPLSSDSNLDALTLLLGRGSARQPSVGGQPLDTPYKRLVRPARRGGGLLEGHDYGGGDVRWFRRKNESALQQAAQAVTAQRGGRSLFTGRSRPGGGVAALEATLAQLDPEQQKRVRYLLGR